MNKCALLPLVALSLSFAPAPLPKPLYSDADIEKRYARFRELGGDPNEHFLGIVPNGTSQERGEVFRRLGIDERRLRDRRYGIRMHVVSLVWQVAPSYDLSIMTATNERATKKVELFSLKRKVYGVRVEKRGREQPFLVSSPD